MGRMAEKYAAKGGIFPLRPPLFRTGAKVFCGMVPRGIAAPEAVPVQKKGFYIGSLQLE